MDDGLIVHRPACNPTESMLIRLAGYIAAVLSLFTSL